MKEHRPKMTKVYAAMEPEQSAMITDQEDEEEKVEEELKELKEDPEDQEDTEEEYENVEETTDPRNQVTVYYDNKPILATINSGSLENIVREAVTKSKIDLPIIESNLQMIQDADGNHMTTFKSIENIPLQYGNIETIASRIFVTQKLPCEMILGYSWLKENSLTIGKYKGRRGIGLKIIQQDTDPPEEYFLGYGPFPNPAKDLPQFINLDSRIYPCLFKDVDVKKELYFNYGNPPYHEHEPKEISEDFKKPIIESVMNQFPAFFLKVMKLINRPEFPIDKTIKIPKTLCHRAIRTGYTHYFDRKAKNPFNPYDTFRYRDVEDIISVATHLKYRPDGQIRQFFNQKYPREAAEIFDSTFYIKPGREISEKAFIKPKSIEAAKDRDQFSEDLNMKNQDNCLEIESKDDNIQDPMVLSCFVNDYYEESRRNPLKRALIGGTNKIMMEMTFITDFFEVKRSESNKCKSELACLVKNMNISDSELAETDQSDQPKGEDQTEFCNTCCGNHQFQSCTTSITNPRIQMNNSGRLENKESDTENLEQKTNAEIQDNQDNRFDDDRSSLGIYLSRSQSPQMTSESHFPSMDSPDRPAAPELEYLYEFLNHTPPEEIRAMFALVHGRNLISQHPYHSPFLISLDMNSFHTHLVKTTLICPEEDTACAEFTSDHASI